MLMIKKGLLRLIILAAENKYLNLRKFAEIKTTTNQDQQNSGRFFGKLTSFKWAKIAKCSQDAAGRDIQDLLAKNVLFKEDGGGRSVGFALVW